MAKNRSAAGITNIVQYDANRNITFVSGSTTLLTVSSSGALTTTGTITAQTLVVQTVTSSVNFITGSTKFGSLIGNTHQFTGSVTVTGSLAVVTTGTEFQVTNTGVNLGNVLTDSHVISGSLRVNPNGLFVSSSGNAGIGTTSPVGKLDINAGGNTNIVISNDSVDTGYNIISLNGTRTKGSYAGIAGGGTGDNNLYLNSGNDVVVQTGASYTARIRINSNGVPIIIGNGTSSSGRIEFYSDTTPTHAASIGTTGAGIAGVPDGSLRFNLYSGTWSEKMRLSSTGCLRVEGNTMGWTIGQVSGENRIQYNGSSFVLLNTGNGFTAIAASAFNVNSDYRLKEDLKDFNNALNVVDSIKIYDFKWKNKEERNYGVLAHELQEVLPYTVYGEKDGVDQNEEIITQGVDYGKLVPVLVKAIQELKSQNDSLQQQINELKA